MAKTLTKYVHFDGKVYKPGDKVPDGVTNPKAWATEDGAGDEVVTSGEDLFDPTDASVDEVNNHLAEADDDEVERVLGLEAAGKNRKGIVEGPYAPEATD